jgi:hypothetical protein
MNIGMGDGMTKFVMLAADTEYPNTDWVAERAGAG